MNLKEYSHGKVKTWKKLRGLNFKYKYTLKIYYYRKILKPILKKLLLGLKYIQI